MEKKFIVYPNLLAEMARNGESRKMLSSTIGISEHSFGKKLKGLISWNINDINAICKHYKKTYEELFK